MSDNSLPSEGVKTKKFSEMSLLELSRWHEKRNAEIFGPFMKYRNSENMCLLADSAPQKAVSSHSLMDPRRQGRRTFDGPSWSTNDQRLVSQDHPSSDGQGQRRPYLRHFSDGRLCDRHCQQCGDNSQLQKQ